MRLRACRLSSQRSMSATSSGSCAIRANCKPTIQGRSILNLPRSLSQRFFSRSDAAVFLIGKDGGLKASARQLDLPALFARVDAMPMRRREMEAAE